MVFDHHDCCSREKPPTKAACAHRLIEATLNLEVSALAYAVLETGGDHDSFGTITCKLSEPVHTSIVAVFQVTRYWATISV